MNRQILLATGALSLIQQTSAPTQFSRSLSSRTNTHNRNGSGDVSSIEEWLASLNNNAETVPSSIVKTKGSSPKVTCRAPIDALRNHVPQKVLQRAQDSHQYKGGSDALVVTSDKGPSASTKQKDCINKIQDILRETARNIITEASRRPPKQP